MGTGIRVETENCWHSAETQSETHVSKGSRDSDSSKGPGLFGRIFNKLKSGNEDRLPTEPLRTTSQRHPATSQINRTSTPTTWTGRRPGYASNQEPNHLATSTLIGLAAMGSSGKRCGSSFPKFWGHGSTAADPVARSASLDPTESTDFGTNGAIGELSARFESGDKGPAAIGYDQRGGTSYGTYQISSRSGTMGLFVEYLEDRAPDLAKKLEAAGPANTGGRSGRMPKVWQKIAAEDPARFSKLQSDFIEETHYQPALQEIAQRTGVDLSLQPKAVREVLWSTAVQHGAKGATNVFCRAIGRSGKARAEQAPASLIQDVYQLRSGSFGSSSSGMRSSLRDRFRQERNLALAMLHGQKSDGTAVV